MLPSRKIHFVLFCRLTAFVVKSFSEAKPFTFIDDNVINRAVNWLVNNQDPSGAFRETGNVIHKEMQVGDSSVCSTRGFCDTHLLSIGKVIHISDSTLTTGMLYVQNIMVTVSEIRVT